MTNSLILLAFATLLIVINTSNASCCGCCPCCGCCTPMQPVNPPLVVKMSPVRPGCCPCPCCCGGCPCCCGCPCCGGGRRRRSLHFLCKQTKPYGASRASRFRPL